MRGSILKDSPKDWRRFCLLIKKIVCLSFLVRVLLVRETSLVEIDVTRYDDFLCSEIKASIAAMVVRITKKDAAR